MNLASQLLPLRLCRAQNALQLHAPDRILTTISDQSTPNNSMRAVSKWLSQVLRGLIIKWHCECSRGFPWLQGQRGQGCSSLLPVLLPVLHPVSGQLPQGAASHVFQSSLLYVKCTYKQPSSIPRGSYCDRGMLTIYFCLFFSFKYASTIAIPE